VDVAFVPLQTLAEIYGLATFCGKALWRLKRSSSHPICKRTPLRETRRVITLSARETLRKMR
jgi:hypothetical protein